MKAKELREKAGEIAQKLDTITLECRQAGRPLSEDEQKQFTELRLEATKYLTEADGYEILDTYEGKKLQDLKANRHSFSPIVNTREKASEDLAIRAWLGDRLGYDVPQEWHEHAKQFGMTSKVLTNRAWSTSGSGLGADFIPTNFADTVYEKALASGGIISMLARTNGTFRTDNGDPWFEPIQDATGLTGAVVAEGAADTTTDIVTSGKTFGSIWYSSGIQLYSYQQVRDSRYPIRDRVVRGLSEALNRKVNVDLWNGNASASPAQAQGLRRTLTTGVTTASPTAFTVTELRQLMASVPEPHASNGVFLFSRDALFFLFGILDDIGRSLWQDSIQDGIPSRLFGHDVYVDLGMDTVAATNKPVVFGDIGRGYKVRLVGDLVIRASDDRYFEYNQTGVVAGQSLDAGAVDSSTYKCLTMHA